MFLESEKDNIFIKEQERQFQFDERIALVFDNMADRSIPFYRENMNLIVKIIDRWIKNDGTVIDLGCSTASLLLQIERELRDKNLNLIGIDSSEAMVERGKGKINAFNSKIKIFHEDILLLSEMRKSDIVIMNYTLQFIRPIYREELLKKIFDSLSNDCILFLTEKVVSSETKFNKNLIDIYYSYKRDKGYSEYEISQKREALENVLVPYTEDENKQLLKKVGFRHIENVFRWANFSTMVAFK